MIIASLSASAFILLLGATASAHHVAFCQAIIQAVEKPDLTTVKDLFDEAAWKETGEGMSALALQDLLKRGKLSPLLKTSDAKFDAYSSYDKLDSRLRCILTFRIKNDGKTEQVYLLAKRIGDDGYSNPKAWRIWRIVTDQSQAECFLGRKISGRELTEKQRGRIGSPGVINSA